MQVNYKESKQHLTNSAYICIFRLHNQTLRLCIVSVLHVNCIVKHFMEPQVSRIL